VIAPGQTPRDILTKLNTELNAIVATDDVRNRLTDLGMNPIGKGFPDDLQRFLDSEIDRWGKVVETAGIARSE
jgi:tripartite-type tricarboxylate transporter receptor subunit TctC